jgi:hypothetical protein
VSEAQRCEACDRPAGSAPDVCLGCATTRLAELHAALPILSQALLEVAHAQECGAQWYTRGADGLYNQVAMWVRKGRAAIAAVQPKDVNA